MEARRDPPTLRYGMHGTAKSRLHIRRIAARVRGDAGFALPTTLMLLLAAFAIVSVGVVSSVNVQRGVVRDQGTKSAVQLAESGVDTALLHFNRITPTGGNACSPVSGTLPNGSGWCPAITTNDVTGGTFTYQVRPTTGMIEIVGTGTVNGATRRVYVQAHTGQGQPIFVDGTVKSKDGIHLDSNAEIHANAATNGDYTLDSNAKQCGTSTIGLGRHMTLTSNAKYYLNQNCTVQSTNPSQAAVVLPDVNQGDAATNNDNARFFSQDLVSGQTSRVCFNHVKANGQSGTCGTKGMTMNSNVALTLGGAKYSFCSLNMSSNSSLYVAAGKTVTIYFDSPEACGLSSGATQLDLNSNSRITSTTGGPANVAMLFVGSQTRS